MRRFSIPPLPSGARWLLLLLPALIVAYVFSIWVFAPLAAAIAAAWRFAGAHALGVESTEVARLSAKAGELWGSVGYYGCHPFQTAWAWVTRAELTHPEVRAIWLGLVVALAVAGLALWVWVRSRGGGLQVAAGEDKDIQKLAHKKIKVNLPKELQKIKSDRVFLGMNDHRRPVTVAWEKMTEHVHILGGSGTGKTSLAVLPICVQAVRRGSPTIIIDFKGDKQTVQVVAREAQKAGKKFYFFSLNPDIPSNTYNPLGSGSPLSKVERVMTALELVFSGQAKFYSYCQQAVFLPLLRALNQRGIAYTLADIAEILRQPKLAAAMTGESVNPSQLKGLVAALAPYQDLEVINNSEPDIDLAAVMRAGDVVYFDLRSAVAPAAAGALGKMIAMDLQSQAVSRTQADPITVVAIDEFQNMACDAFRNIVSKLRASNYSLVLANQAMGDLRAVSQDFENVVNTNTATKIVFGVEDPMDALHFAHKTGEITVTVRSASTSKQAGEGLRRRETYGDSLSEQQKPLIHQNVFLSLPFGKSVIFRRSELATLANHGHLISKIEKDALEAEPYPAPAVVSKNGVETVDGWIAEIKAALAAASRSSQDSGAGTDVEMEEIDM